MWEDIIWRGWNWAGYTKGKRMASFLSGTGMGNTALAGLIIGGTINNANLERLVKQLKAYKPQHFYVLSTAAYIVAKYLLEHNDESLKVDSIITTGEPLYDWQREVIEEAFQCKVFDEWGSNDGANTGYDCSEHLGLHHAAERNIIEIVDGRIIATDLWNYALPFIRYENGDAGKWLDECSCNRKLPLLKIYGRMYDLILTPTEIVIPDILARPLLNLAIGIESFQIIQKSLDLVEIKVVKESNFSNLEFQKSLTEIKEILKELEVKVSFEDEIPLTPAGKRRFVINETNIDIIDYLTNLNT
jgi:phenylacetate-CoA ligase